MKKLLVICGPTATGKTNLALKLAKQLNGELISADSRQVYQHMNIVTGKDIPKGFRYFSSRIKIKDMKVGYYSGEEIRIWGYDLVSPKDDFSVSLYKKFVTQVISDIQKRKKTPIAVGGTGLYVKSLTEPLDLISIPKNPILRKKLTTESPEELFKTYTLLSPAGAESLNTSDRNNPRRLIRKIEIAKYLKTTNHAQPDSLINDLHHQDCLSVGLFVSSKNIHEVMIRKRVEKRIGKGLFEEIDYLRRNGLMNYMPSQTIGYLECLKYIDNLYTKDELISSWTRSELQYTKRQMTWFKKASKINWFDILMPNYKKEIEKFVKRWHNTY